MKNGIDNRGRMQEQLTVPVVEDPSLPTMEPVAAFTANVEAEAEPLAHMAEEGLKVPAPSALEGDRMAPFHPAAELKEGQGKYMTPVSETVEPIYPDQEEAAPSATRRAGKEEAGYLRLTFKVENGQMSLVEARGVPGPLVAEQDVREAEMVYEVTRSQQRIDAGVIPPHAHLVRGMAHPEASGELSGHHISELGSIEFTARIPVEALSLNTLDEVGAAVYRVKGGEAINVPASAAPMRQTDASERLRVVAELKSINLESLSSTMQEELRATLR